MRNSLMYFTTHSGICEDYRYPKLGEGVGINFCLGPGDMSPKLICLFL